MLRGRFCVRWPMRERELRRGLATQGLRAVHAPWCVGAHEKASDVLRVGAKPWQSDERSIRCARNCGNSFGSSGEAAWCARRVFGGMEEDDGVDAKAAEWLMQRRLIERTARTVYCGVAWGAQWAGGF